MLWHLDLFVFGRYFQNKYYSYSYLDDFSKPNIFVFVFAWFPKPEWYSYSVEVWKPKRMYFTLRFFLKFSSVFKGTEDPVCNFHCSNFWYFLLFNWYSVLGKYSKMKPRKFCGIRHEAFGPPLVSNFAGKKLTPIFFWKLNLWWLIRILHLVQLKNLLFFYS